MDEIKPENIDIEEIRAISASLRDINCEQPQAAIKHDLRSLASQLYNLTLDFT